MRRRQFWLTMFLAALSGLVCSAPAAAQQGNTVTIRFAGAPTGTCFLFQLGIDNSTGDFYDCFAGSWNMIGGGGGGGTPGGAAYSTQYNATGGAFGGAGPGTAGQVLESNGPGVPPGFADPIVSGPDAVGSALTKNPVQIGGSDYGTSCGGGPCAQEAKVSSTGSVSVAVVGTVPVSGTVAVTQSTSPWIVAGGGTAGSPGTVALTVQGIGSGTPVPVSLATAPTTSVTQGTSPWVVSNGGTFAVQDATVEGAISSSVMQGNVKQINGVVPLMGNGVTGTGSQRVTIASDNTAFSVNASVSCAATNCPTNTVQLGGTAIDTNSGNKSAGTQRVVLATDQPNLTTPLNANVAQVAGTTTDTNSGNKSAGTQRVVLATDQPTLANFGDGSTGSAVPTVANYIGGNGSGNLTGFLRCDSSALYDTNTNGKTQLVALSSGKVTYVCGVSITQSTTSAVTVSLGSGTGTNCATTYVAKTPAWPIQSGTSVGPAGLTLSSGLAPWFQTAASEELCISTNAAVSVQALVSYTQF